MERALKWKFGSSAAGNIVSLSSFAVETFSRSKVPFARASARPNHPHTRSSAIFGKGTSAAGCADRLEYRSKRS